MNSSVSPARVLQVIGGIGMLVASFLEWAGSIEGVTANGWDVGMLGLWQTIIGALIAMIGLIGITKGSSVFPAEVFGFDFEHAVVVIAFPVLLWNFGLQFDEIYGGLGLFVGWISAAVAIGGSELQRRTFSGA